MKGLGRGLDALLSSSEAPDETNISRLSIYLIDNNAQQPRKHFDEAKLRELAESIEQHGIVQPIIVRRNGERYTIIAGERRFRAARLAGLNEVPVIIREMDEQETREVALIENLQREDLNPIEEAKAIRALMDEHDLTQEEAAAKLGKSRPAIANTLRLLALPERMQQLLLESRLKAGHVQVLASIPDEELLIATAEKAANENWSVRETEKRVDELLMSRSMNKRQPKREKLPNELKSAQDSLRERLGSKVSFKGSSEKGRIIIEYFSSEELNGLYDMLMGAN